MLLLPRLLALLVAFGAWSAAASPVHNDHARSLYNRRVSAQQHDSSNRGYCARGMWPTPEAHIRMCGIQIETNFTLTSQSVGRADRLIRTSGPYTYKLYLTS